MVGGGGVVKVQVSGRGTYDSVPKNKVATMNPMLNILHGYT